MIGRQPRPKPEPKHRIKTCRFANTTRRRPASRFKTSQTFDDITTSEPYRPLTEKLHRSGGRNNQGELTSWWRGGGHKRLYRIIDFKRDKKDIPGRIETVEYDPNRSSRIALVTYADGEKRYILQPAGMKVGDTVVAGDNVDILPGNCLPLKNIPLGTTIHNVELRPGRAARSRAVPARRCSWWRAKASTRRSRCRRARFGKINVECVATIGQVGNIDHENVSHRQGGTQPLAGQAAARAWRGDEPG